VLAPVVAAPTDYYESGGGTAADRLSAAEPGYCVTSSCVLDCV
jgi:hypothetical protein